MPLSEEHAALIPDDIRSDPGLQSFNDFGGLAKSYLETKSLVGSSIRLPAKDSKPEDVEKWHGETSAKLKDHGLTLTKLSDIPVGPPASPDAYEFKIEGVEPDVVKGDPVINSFRAFAHSKGLDNEKANGLVNWYLKDVVPMMKQAGDEAAAEARKAAEVPYIDDPAEVDKILTSEFKDEVVSRRNDMDKAVLQLVQKRPSIKDTLLEGTSPYGTPKRWIDNTNNPDIIWLLSEVGRMQQPDFGGNVTSGLSPDGQAAQAEATDIQSNPSNPKYQLYRSGDPTTNAYVNSLLSKAHGNNEIDVNDFKPRLKVG